jgi:hypothetical protein
VIRFNCPNCGRRYELPNAMAHLPLVCKGCAQPLAVPEPGPEPEPEPVPPLAVRPRPAKADSAVLRKEMSPADELPTLKPDHPADAPAPEHAPLPDFAAGPTTGGFGDAPKPPLPAKPASVAPAPTGGSKLIPVVVDVAVGLILLVVGVFLGEMLAGKPTREVLSEAGSAPKFPPLELIQWLGPPLLFGLTYAMLASRGLSVGGWLKRRRE